MPEVSHQPSSHALCSHAVVAVEEGFSFSLPADFYSTSSLGASQLPTSPALQLSTQVWVPRRQLSPFQSLQVPKEERDDNTRWECFSLQLCLEAVPCQRLSTICSISLLWGYPKGKGFRSSRPLPAPSLLQTVPHTVPFWTGTVLQAPSSCLPDAAVEQGEKSAVEHCWHCSLKQYVASVTGAALCLWTGAGGAESSPASQLSARTEAPATRTGMARVFASCESCQLTVLMAARRACSCEREFSAACACPVLTRPPGTVCSSVMLLSSSVDCGVWWEVLLRELWVQNCLQGRRCQILGRLLCWSPAGVPGWLLSLLPSRKRPLSSILGFSEVYLNAFC